MKSLGKKTNAQGVSTEVFVTPITVDKVYKSDFQKEGTLSAQIRQTLKTVSLYPSKKVSSSLQANIFDATEFGFTEQLFESEEHRVAWIPVPIGTTPEQVTAKLAALPDACIYRVLSNAPILDENQLYAINNPAVEATKDTFADSQALRYPAGSKDAAGESNEGKLVLDKAGNVQYRRTFFWKTEMADQDARGKEIYISPALEAELKGASVMKGQTV